MTKKRTGGVFTGISVLALLVWLLGCATEEPIPCWSWEDLGYVSVGASGEYWETYSRTAIAFSPVDRKPIVAFCEGSAIKVREWSSGTDWTDLGSPGAGYYPSLAIDPSDGKPFVAYSGSARVKKWSSGTTWIDYGSAGTGPQTLFTCLVVDPADNKPVVAFVEDQGSGSRARVMKWSSGTAWTDLGYVSTGGASYVSLAIGEADSKPVVAYSDDAAGYVTRVMKWSSGTNWDDQGFPFPAALEGTDTALTIDESDNKPVALNRAGYVYKWSNGTSWTDMGEIVAFGHLMSPAMILDPADQAPIVAFIDELNNYKACISKWLGGASWSEIGYPSSGQAAHPSLAIDPADNSIFIIFNDGSEGWRAHVVIGRYE